MTAHFRHKRILVTRSEPKASEFAAKITQAGGEAFIAPLIKVACKSDKGHKVILQNIHDYDWLFFTSANGVTCFFEALKRHSMTEQLLKMNIAAVGSKTNLALEEFGYRADFIPSVFNAKTMAPEFMDSFSVNGPVLLVRGQLSGTVLNEVFLEHDIPFDCLEVYETVTNLETKQSLQQILTTEEIDFITFSSPSTVDAFMELVEDTQAYLKNMVVCIGTTTESRALKYGFERILVPDEFTTEGMMDRIHDYIVKEG